MGWVQNEVGQEDFVLALVDLPSSAVGARRSRVAALTMNLHIVTTG